MLEHARNLAADHDMQVTIGLEEPSRDEQVPDGVELDTVRELHDRQFDVVVATWWRTAYALFRIPAARRAYFVQNFEQRLYRPGEVERLGAAITHGLPLTFLTQARWIAEALRELRPETACFHVPNGIDKELFRVPAAPSRHDGPLRVLVEGSPSLWFKGIDDAVAAIRAMREPSTVTLVTPEPPPPESAGAFDRVLGPVPHEQMPAVYFDADVILKLSRVEGVFTPPLEAFHCGATCVVWPVTGHDEYVEHGVNGAVVDWDDTPGTAAWLDLLARDRDLLHRLRGGALQTAVRWPSWRGASAEMARALRSMVEGAEPSAGSGAARLLADADGAIEELRLAQLRLRRASEREALRASALADRAAALESRKAELEARVARLEASPAGKMRSRAARLLASFRR